MNQHVSDILSEARMKNYEHVIVLLDGIYKNNTSKENTIAVEFEEHILIFLKSLIKDNKDDTQLENVLFHMAQYICEDKNSLSTFLYLSSAQGLNLNIFSNLFKKLEVKYITSENTSSQQSISNISLDMNFNIIRNYIKEDNSYHILNELGMINFNHIEETTSFLKLLINDYLTLKDFIIHHFGDNLDLDSRHRNIINFVNLAANDYKIKFLVPLSESLVNNTLSKNTALESLFYEHCSRLPYLHLIKIKMHLDKNFLICKNKKPERQIKFAKDIKENLSKFILYNQLQQKNRLYEQKETKRNKI